MARKFEELREDLLGRMTPADRLARNKRVDRTVARLRLRQMREGRELSQVALAARLGMDQGSISRMEKQADMHLSTLRNYVEAAGGRLELHAIFPDETMTLEVSE
jgi:DNA-binding XRE family transcriptional regulator